MSKRSSYLPFSTIREDKKKKLDDLIDMSIEVLKSFFHASHAVRETLIKTEIKGVSVTLTFIGRIVQSESGMAQAMATVFDRTARSEDFRDILAANIPQIILPEKQLKK